MAGFQVSIYGFEMSTEDLTVYHTALFLVGLSWWDAPNLAHRRPQLPRSLNGSTACVSINVL
jgi:hypothetical protein